MKKNNIVKKPIIVMKFGGTSLLDEKSRSQAVKHIHTHFKSDKQIVVVVSAMGRKGEPYATDTLISLMKNVGEPVNPAELDSVISLGETLSAAYFSHLLCQNGLPSESFSGSKAGILTDDKPGNAEILGIDPFRLLSSLNLGNIPVVAGFQGANSVGDIRTLGRGGSDTSAVALGSAINAEMVEIYSDVDGIANCDPSLIPEASFMDIVSIRQALSMANEGSQIIHPRAVKASIKTKTPIFLRNTFNNSKGTAILHNTSKLKIEKVVLAHRVDMVLVQVIQKKNFISKILPEMILVDQKRCILKNDVYLEDKIKKIQQTCGLIRKEKGWATISVVFDKIAKKSISVQGAEIIPSGENVICYLLKENKLAVSLKHLFNHYQF